MEYIFTFSQQLWPHAPEFFVSLSPQGTVGVGGFVREGWGRSAVRWSAGGCQRRNLLEIEQSACEQVSPCLF